jgi:hypothetical protein
MCRCCNNLLIVMTIIIFILRHVTSEYHSMMTCFSRCSDIMRSFLILFRVVKIRPALEGDKEAFLNFQRESDYLQVSCLSISLADFYEVLYGWLEEQLFCWLHFFCANTSWKLCNLPFILSTIMGLSLIASSTLILHSVAVVLMHVSVGQSSSSIDCIAIPT